MLFAAHAAVAIANARAFRNERRARADLEALVDTAPVGVVVLDAATGRLVSLNREARRIVERLRRPGSTTEDLLDVVTCRRADGSELALDTFPLATVLRSAERVRAEEIVLSAPDGPSVAALLSATPVHGDGGIETVVIALQDLAPIEELDRMRADFLGMVSHELRVPLTSIKGATTTVLAARRAFRAAELVQFFRIVDDQTDRMTDLIGDLIDAGSIDARTPATVEPDVTAGDPHGLVQGPEVIHLPAPRPAAHPPAEAARGTFSDAVRAPAQSVTLFDRRPIGHPAPIPYAPHRHAGDRDGRQAPDCPFRWRGTAFG